MFSEPELIRLALVVRRQECARLGIPYVRPASLMIKGQGDQTTFYFYGPLGDPLWKVSRSTLINITEDGNYFFDPDPKTRQPRKAIRGTQLREEFFKTYCLA